MKIFIESAALPRLQVLSDYNFLVYLIQATNKRWSKTPHPTLLGFKILKNAHLLDVAGNIMHITQPYIEV